MATCMICGGEPGPLSFPYGTSWNGTAYEYRRCRRCRSTFVCPCPSERELQAIYRWADYHARHYDHPADRAGEGNHERTLALLRPLLPGRKRLLDFGCGSGGFLAAAARSGFLCHGVEYDPETIRRTHEATGIPVTDLEALGSQGLRFDIIHMNDVLPHLPDPEGMLRRLERHLAPGGLFCIHGPLEDNASLVRWVAGVLKTIRRGLGLDRQAEGPPTMLVRLHRKAQREFFTRRLGYAEWSFTVYETGWPYYGGGRRWFASPGTALKQALGLAAILVSSVQPPSMRWCGNRFLAVSEPRAERSG
jgi:SAM-dependent methyltransferase